MKSLRDITEDVSLKNEIDETYIYNTGRGITDEFEKIKLHLNKRDDVVYRIILNTPYEKLDGNLSSSQKDSRVYQNYMLFRKLIESYISKGNDEGKIFDSLEKLTFVELEVQNERPQEIFESLNSTGLALSNVDLLRNFLLMQFDHRTQSFLYDTYWVEIEDNVGVTNMENFFVDYLVYKKRTYEISIKGRRTHIGKGSLYKAFREYYKTNMKDDKVESIEPLFGDMLRCSKEYRKLVFSNSTDPFSLEKTEQKFYEIIVADSATATRSLLLYLLMAHVDGRISNDELYKSAEAVASLSMRAKICGYKGVNLQFAGSVMRRMDNVEEGDDFVNALWYALSSGNRTFAFPQDAEFRKTLKSISMYQTLRSKGTKYFLYMIEKNSPFPKGLPAFDDSTISIEHIMPQTLSEEWKKSLGADIKLYDTYLHGLGNLALVSMNSELNNKPFEKKKEIYKEANFYYTRRICDYDKWNIESIEKRAEEFADIALKIWHYPEYLQKERHVSVEMEHNLDEDLSQFSFLKPKNITIGEKQYQIKTWSQMLGTICRHLVNEDHDSFIKSTIAEKNKNFRAYDDLMKNNMKMTDYARVDGDLYIKTAKSAYDTLQTAARILMNFDSIAKTDMYNSFTFEVVNKV